LHSIPWDSKRPALAEVSGEFVPPLLAGSVDEHFRVMAQDLAAPYLQAAQTFAQVDWDGLVFPETADYEAFFCPQPNSRHRSGWFHFNGKLRKFEAIEGGPVEEAVIFDVETAPGVPRFAKAPILACAMGRKGLYLWVSDIVEDDKDLRNSDHSEDMDSRSSSSSIRSTSSITTKTNIDIDIDIDTTATYTSTANTISKLIQLPNPLLVIGHHISYDRARLSCQYQLNRSPMRFLDTLSMHCAVAGISSQQRGLWKEQQKMTDSPSELDEGEEDPALDSTSSSLTKWCKFGSLNNLKDALKLHCNLDLDKSVRSEILLSARSTLEIIQKLPKIAEYCAEDVRTTGKLFSALLPKFLKKSPHPVTFSALLEMSTFIVPIESLHSWQKYIDKCEGLLQEATSLLQSKLEALVESIIAQYPPGSPDPVDDPWLGQLDWERKDTLRWTKPKFLKDGKTYAKGGEPVPLGNARLHQQPAWYRKLWKAGGIKVTPRTSIVPLLLKLQWKERPLALIPERGWCYVLKESESEAKAEAEAKAKAKEGKMLQNDIIP
jgi:hypothetical protein